jgi:hypothetical protein
MRHPNWSRFINLISVNFSGYHLEDSSLFSKRTDKIFSFYHTESVLSIQTKRIPMHFSNVSPIQNIPWHDSLLHQTQQNTFAFIRFETGNTRDKPIQNR